MINKIKFWHLSVFGLFVWALYSIAWYSHLEGDVPLYPMMSIEVLKGKNFIMTAGQAHGGTLLVYIRALFFYIFGIHQTLSFFLNGMVVVAGALLWSRFAFKVWGRGAALIMFLLGTIVTESFARAAGTDYFAFTLVSSGLMLNYSLALSKKSTLKSIDFFGMGLLFGVSWYICRFSSLYVLPAFEFYYLYTSKENQSLLLPSKAELKKSKPASAFFLFFIVGILLSVIAFFASDRFLGINAESNLKVSIYLGMLAWILLRFNFLLKNIFKLSALALGFFIGIIPEIIFKILVKHPDRVTGLVRWSDLSELFPKTIFKRITIGFSFYDSDHLGVLVFIAIAIMIFSGFFLKKKLRKDFYSLLLLVIVPFAAWLSIHTYMHAMVQYFFPIFYPVFLMTAFLYSQKNTKYFATVAFALMLVSGLHDLYLDLKMENAVKKSKVIETLTHLKRKYNISNGWGDFPSNYNIMWAGAGEHIIPWRIDEERFPYWQKASRSQSKVFYIHHGSDRVPEWDLNGYIVLEKVNLAEGYTIYALSKR